MKPDTRGLYFATALAILPVGALAVPQPAMAQAEAAVSFDAFHDLLAPYGAWIYSGRWGVVWQPTAVAADFRPYYSNGRWVYTEQYGWFWSSDYEWADIPFHYGRWIDDPDQGWLWIPGYTWSPGWVVWRQSPDYVGWMPMPPDDAFLAGDDAYGPAVTAHFDDIGGDYGYSRWYGPSYGPSAFASAWIFLGVGHLADRDYRPYVVPQPRVVNIIHETRNITNYTVVNNYIVNRSVTVQAVEHARGQPVRPVRAAAFVRRPALITNVAVGRQARSHALPRGTGLPDSAPRPPEAVMRRLSPAPAHQTRPAAAHPAASPAHPPATAGHPETPGRTPPSPYDTHRRPASPPSVSEPVAPRPAASPAHAPATADHPATPGRTPPSPYDTHRRSANPPSVSEPTAPRPAAVPHPAEAHPAAVPHVAAPTRPAPQRPGIVERPRAAEPPRADYPSRPGEPRPEVGRRPAERPNGAAPERDRADPADERRQ